MSIGFCSNPSRKDILGDGTRVFERKILPELVNPMVMLGTLSDQHLAVVVKNRYPKMGCPGKWKRGLKPAVCW